MITFADGQDPPVLHVVKEAGISSLPKPVTAGGFTQVYWYGEFKKNLQCL